MGPRICPVRTPMPPTGDGGPKPGPSRHWGIGIPRLNDRASAGITANPDRHLTGGNPGSPPASGPPPEGSLIEGSTDAVRMAPIVTN